MYTYICINSVTLIIELLHCEGTIQALNDINPLNILPRVKFNMMEGRIITRHYKLIHCILQHTIIGAPVQTSNYNNIIH